jgi:5S rRNA maturation endonuclease (ribonuclease M5)
MTIEEMENVLDRLGIEIISVTGDEIKAHCPAHLSRTGKIDNNPSWSINADTGAHNCFSCKFRGSLQYLVEYCQGVGFDEAKVWLNTGERNLSKAYERLIMPTPIDSEPNPITESMLSAFTTPPKEALASRGITETAASYFEILWDAQHENWITVIRDPYTNKLLGWQEKGYKGRYFRNYPVGVNKSTAVFGYMQNNGDEMIVVESPLDVARLASVGILGGVSTYGSAVSNAQLKLIRSANKVIFAMDNDEAGRVSSKALMDYAKEMRMECWFFDYSSTDMKDVGGMSKAEIVYGLENANHLIRGRI